MSAARASALNPRYRQVVLRLGIAWFALLALLALTFWLATLPLGAGNVAAALAIATAKTAIVGWWFMSLRRASATTRLAIGLAGFVLAILFALAGVDAVTRLHDPSLLQAARQIEPAITRSAAAASEPPR